MMTKHHNILSDDAWKDIQAGHKIVLPYGALDVKQIHLLDELSIEMYFNADNKEITLQLIPAEVMNNL